MKLIVILLVFLLSVSYCAVETHAGIVGGEREVSGLFTIMKPTDGDGMWMLFGTVGYFINPNIRLAGVGILMGDTDDTAGLIGGQFDYFFNTGKDVVPYIGTGAMTDIGNDASSNFLVDIHGGFKQFIAEQLSINYELKYLTIVGDDNADGGLILGTIGLSFYF